MKDVKITLKSVHHELGVTIKIWKHQGKTINYSWSIESFDISDSGFDYQTSKEALEAARQSLQEED